MDKKNENKEEMTWEGLAMEIVAGKDRISRFKNFVIVGLLVVVVAVSAISYVNDEKWRQMFNNFDFVSQDGHGYNYYNSGIDGDVTNGTAHQASEEQK